MFYFIKQTLKNTEIFAPNAAQAASGGILKMGLYGI